MLNTLFVILFLYYCAGNVPTVKLHTKAATLTVLTYFILGLYNVVLGSNDVPNVPRGRGLYPAQGLIEPKRNSDISEGP